ncbi:MAG TPA: HEAT repeat domain-containing protein [Thermococcus litoralis]|uniref:HEAT repeat domain-containing protein n=1 Tax=Thermococcus litoralis TaxID=2265 RepID=A0A7C5JYM4_THELI|nr:HEAT repeat domain-containing protein [Thermococcus litoralis]
MVKYFVVITGFATLVGTFYSILEGTGFYVALVLSFLLALGTLVAWYQSDRANYLKAIVHPLLMAHIKCVGAEVVPLVVEIAKSSGMHNQVADVLVEALLVKPDPTERHWIYVALGKIGGKKAKSAVKRGLSEEDEFARLGAEEAWKLLMAH